MEFVVKRKRALSWGGGIFTHRTRMMEMWVLLTLVLSVSILLCRVDATYIPCAAASGSNAANVQICPTGQCCGVNGYCGTGQGYCGKGNCLSQCPSSPPTTVSPPGLLLPPPPPHLYAPPPPIYYYTGGGSNIADLEYHDYHHHHNIDTVWKIVGIVAAIVSLILLGLILCVLLAKAARKRKHACECDHL